LIAHIGGMDCCARGLKAAARMIEDRALSGPLEERYAGWKSAEGQAILSGKRTLEEVAERVVREKIEPQPKSGRQEYLENIVNRYV
jgi:xylose isomerase